MNRPLLHAEELEGRIIADGPVCTCRSGEVCPMCGGATADEGCAVHDGRELAALLKEAQDPESEAIQAIVSDKIADMTTEEKLGDDFDGVELLNALWKSDKNTILDWIESEVAEDDVRYLRAGEVLKQLPAAEVLSFLAEEEKDAFRDWINENVEAEMMTDDLGQKVPTLNITGL